MVIFLLIVLMGGIISFLGLQSKKDEIAVSRSLGATKKSISIYVLCENVITCIVGIIIGSSGCGNTTLLSLLSGLDLPFEWTISYSGVSTSEIDRYLYRRNDVTVIYQAFNLFPLLTRLENVLYPMELLKTKKATALSKAKELISSVGLTEKVYKQYPKMMSGGEQQRIAIAKGVSF